MSKSCLLGLAAICLAALVMPASAQDNAPAPQANGGGRGANRPPPAPPAADLTGSWVLASEEAAPTMTLVLKQTGPDLVGSMKLQKPLPGLPPIDLHGSIEGSDMDLMSWFDYQGGELMHIRASLKDGHLVGQRFSVHSAPHKWRIDGTFEVDYVRAK